MKLKILFIHLWKYIKYPDFEGRFGMERRRRNLYRNIRLSKIRKNKELIREIYDLSEMD